MDGNNIFNQSRPSGPFNGPAGSAVMNRFAEMADRAMQAATSFLSSERTEADNSYSGGPRQRDLRMQHQGPGPEIQGRGRGAEGFGDHNIGNRQSHQHVRRGGMYGHDARYSEMETEQYFQAGQQGEGGPNPREYSNVGEEYLREHEFYGGGQEQGRGSARGYQNRGSHMGMMGPGPRGRGQHFDGGRGQQMGRGQDTHFGREGDQALGRGLDQQFGRGRGQDEHFGRGRGQDEHFGRGRGQDEHFRRGRGQDEQFGRGRGQDEQFGRGRGQDEQFGRGRGQDEQFGRGRGQDQHFRRGRGQDEKFGRGRGHERVRGRGQQYGRGQNQSFRGGRGILPKPSTDFGQDQRQDQDQRQETEHQVFSTGDGRGAHSSGDQREQLGRGQNFGRGQGQFHHSGSAHHRRRGLLQTLGRGQHHQEDVDRESGRGRNPHQRGQGQGPQSSRGGRGQHNQQHNTRSTNDPQFEDSSKDSTEQKQNKPGMGIDKIKTEKEGDLAEKTQDNEKQVEKCKVKEEVSETEQQNKKSAEELKADGELVNQKDKTVSSSGSENRPGKSSDTINTKVKSETPAKDSPAKDSPAVSSTTNASAAAGSSEVEKKTREEEIRETYSFCKVCDMPFENTEKYVCHILGMLHTQRQMEKDERLMSGGSTETPSQPTRAPPKRQSKYPSPAKPPEWKKLVQTQPDQAERQQRPQPKPANFGAPTGPHPRQTMHEDQGHGREEEGDWGHRPEDGRDRHTYQRGRGRASGEAESQQWEETLGPAFVQKRPAAACSQGLALIGGVGDEEEEEDQEISDEEDVKARTGKGDEIGEFHCTLCDIATTGAVSLRSHLNGRNHKLVQEAVDNGTPIPRRLVTKLGSRAQIPGGNPSLATLKTKSSDGPSKLLELLEHIPEAIVGLRYVKEFQLSRQPTFLCTVCDAQCDSASIQTHLIGTKHRLKYMRDFHMPVYNHVKSHGGKKSQLSAFLEEVCTDIERKEGRGSPIVEKAEEEPGAEKEEKKDETTKKVGPPPAVRNLPHEVVLARYKEKRGALLNPGQESPQGYQDLRGPGREGRAPSELRDQDYRSGDPPKDQDLRPPWPQGPSGDRDSGDTDWRTGRDARFDPDRDFRSGPPAFDRGREFRPGPRDFGPGRNFLANDPYFNLLLRAERYPRPRRDLPPPRPHISKEEQQRRMHEYERHNFYYPERGIPPEETRRRMLKEYEHLGIPYDVACQRVLLQEKRLMKLRDYLREGVPLEEAQKRVLAMESRMQLMREYERQGLSPQEAKWRVIVEEERNKLFEDFERQGFTPLEARVRIIEGHSRTRLINEFERHGMPPHEAHKRALAEEDRLKIFQESAKKGQSERDGGSRTEDMLDYIAEKQMFENYVEQGIEKEEAENKVILVLRRQGVPMQEAIMRVQKIQKQVFEETKKRSPSADREQNISPYPEKGPSTDREQHIYSKRDPSGDREQHISAYPERGPSGDREQHTPSYQERGQQVSAYPDRGPSAERQQYWPTEPELAGHRQQMENIPKASLFGDQGYAEQHMHSSSTASFADRRLPGPAESERKTTSHTTEDVSVEEAKERLLREYEKRGISREQARQSLINELIQSGMSSEEAHLRFADSGSVAETKSKKKHRKRKRKRGSDHRRLSSSSSSSSSLSSSDSSDDNRKRRKMRKSKKDSAPEKMEMQQRGRGGCFLQEQTSDLADSWYREDHQRPPAHPKWEQHTHRHQPSSQEPSQPYPGSLALGHTGNESPGEKRLPFLGEEEPIPAKRARQAAPSSATHSQKFGGYPKAPQTQTTRLDRAEWSPTPQQSHMPSSTQPAPRPGQPDVSAGHSGAQPTKSQLPAQSMDRTTESKAQTDSQPSAQPGDSKPNVKADFTGLLESLTNNLIGSEDDAAMALQVSKALTSALLKYRLKSVADVKGQVSQLGQSPEQQQGEGEGHHPTTKQQHPLDLRESSGSPSQQRQHRSPSQTPAVPSHRPQHPPERSQPQASSDHVTIRETPTERHSDRRQQGKSSRDSRKSYPESTHTASIQEKQSQRSQPASGSRSSKAEPPEKSSSLDERLARLDKSKPGRSAETETRSSRSTSAHERSPSALLEQGRSSGHHQRPQERPATRQEGRGKPSSEQASQLAVKQGREQRKPSSANAPPKDDAAEQQQSWPGGSASSQRLGSVSSQAKQIAEHLKHSLSEAPKPVEPPQQQKHHQQEKQAEDLDSDNGEVFDRPLGEAPLVVDLSQDFGPEAHPPRGPLQEAGLLQQWGLHPETGLQEDLPQLESLPREWLLQTDLLHPGIFVLLSMGLSPQPVDPQEGCLILLAHPHPETGFHPEEKPRLWEYHHLEEFHLLREYHLQEECHLPEECHPQEVLSPGEWVQEAFLPEGLLLEEAGRGTER
ncbi:hypothetical protein ACOMHN_035986 [Nucella lapillus]